MNPKTFHVESSTVYTKIPATRLTGEPTWQNGVWFQVYCHPDTGLDRETVAADIAARLNEPLNGLLAELVTAARAVDRADVYIHERPLALAGIRAALAKLAPVSPSGDIARDILNPL